MNKNIFPISIVAFLAVPALFTSCSSQSDGWSLRGNINGLDSGRSLAIEAPSATGGWYVVDSVHPSSDGTFSYTSAAPAPYPEIMRLTLPGSGNIYFPVDSVDCVTIEAEANSFATKHHINGTASARRINEVDSIIRVVRPDDETGMTNLKRQLADFITADTTAIISYYIINKSLGDKAIFNPSDAFDNRIYGAAAQVFANFRPNDARGKTLTQAYFEGRRALGKETLPAMQTIELPEQGLIDIVRYDSRGNRHSLSELAAKGKPVVLSFTSYDLDSSPAYNIALNEVYSKYRNRGLEIYQLAFNPDELQWKQVARNLPWIAVWNSPTDGSHVVASYNINMLPLTYVIDSHGDIVERVENPADLDSAIRKHI